jgi:CheY-like chemotaxis protein
MNKVLIVEDHRDSLEILTQQLEFLGFNVIEAKHGEEGVEKAFEEKPQVILMDIMMPGMDGREAVRKIRSKPETQDIPILASTVLFLESDLKSCIEAGCNDILQKPFTLNELRIKIQEFIPSAQSI